MIGELRLDGLKSCVYGNVCTLQGRQSSPCFVLLVFSAQKTLEPFYGSLVQLSTYYLFGHKVHNPSCYPLVPLRVASPPND